jgi:hypothetical protein
MMLEEVQKVKSFISVKQVASKVTMSLKELEDLQNNLKGVMMIAYPGYHGVDAWEPAKEILEGNLEQVLRFEGSEVFFLKSTSVTRPACGGPARNS